MSIHTQAFMWTHVFIYSGKYLGVDRIAVSYGKGIFNFIRNHLFDIENKLVATGEKEEGHYRGRGLRGFIKTIMYKISLKIYCKIENDQYFYNNYKWNITFKNCESLYFIPVTYNIIHQL